MHIRKIHQGRGILFTMQWTYKDGLAAGILPSTGCIEEGSSARHVQLNENQTKNSLFKGII